MAVRTKVAPLSSPRVRSDHPTNRFADGRIYEVGVEIWRTFVEKWSRE